MTDSSASGLSGRILLSPALRRGYWGLTLRSRDNLGPWFIGRALMDGRPHRLQAIRPDYAARSPYLARFAREAIAATHLDHPNLVKVENLFSAGGTLVLVSEATEGKALSGAIAARKRLEPRDALVAVLQAARGLRHAHSRGFRHRHLNSNAILIGSDGRVRVQGIGVIPDPETSDEIDRLERESNHSETMARTNRILSKDTYALQDGTTGQVTDLAMRERREDIAALGRILLELLLGVESSASCDDVLRQIEMIPESLRPLVRRMIDPAEPGSFDDLDAVISELERVIERSTKIRLGEAPSELVETVQQVSMRLIQEGSILKAHRVILGASVGCVALILICILAGWMVLAVGFLAIAVYTAIGLAIARRQTAPQPLFQALRNYIVESVLTAPGISVAILLLFLVAHWALNLLGVAILFASASVLLVLVFRRSIDLRAEADQATILEPLSMTLKKCRLQGYDELKLRRWAYEMASGDHDAVMTRLFGAQSVSQASGRWSAAAFGSDRSWLDRHVWLDWVIRWLGTAARFKRYRLWWRLIQVLEERSGCAKGINLVTSRRRSWRVASAIIAVDAERFALGDSSHPTSDLATAFHEAALHPEKILVDHETGLIPESRGATPGSILDLAMGARVRFSLGVAILVGFLVWVHQNRILHVEELQELAGQAIQNRDMRAMRDLSEATQRVKLELPRETKSLEWPPLPRSVTEPIGSLGGGFAGLILVLSSFWTGWRASLVAIPASLIAIFGPGLGLPAIGSWPAETTSLAVAASLVVAGIVLSLRR